MTCPNLSHPTYKAIKSQYGEFAQYVASSLFDNPKFQEWKGDDEIPALDDKGNVLSNLGSTFPLSTYFDEVLAQAELSNPDMSYYERVDGKLKFKETITRESQEKVLANTNLLPTVTPLTTKELNKQIQERIEAQKNNSTEEQTKTLELLADNANKIKFTAADHTYSDGVISYTPTTTAIGSTFKGDSSQYENSRIWGSQLDSLLSNAIRGEEFGPTPNLSETTRKQAIEYFSTLVKELTKDGTKLVTQAILSNSEAQVAGSADLILVRPDGSIDIYDLKTALKSTLDAQYDKQWKGEGGLTRSKRQQHAAQLGMYKALAEGMGLTVNELKVIPVKLNVTGDKVDSVNAEPLIPVAEPRKEVRAILDRRIENIKKGSSTQRDFTKQLEKLKIILQEKIDKIEKSIVQKSGASAKRLGELKELRDKLLGIDQIAEISSVIDAIHVELIGSDGKAGYSRRFDKVVEGLDAVLASGDIDGIREAMRTLNAYKEYVDDYQDLDEYLEIFAKDTNSTVRGEKDSPIEKLREIATVRVAMQQAYYKATRPLLAASLSREINKSANEAALKFLDSKKRLLALAEEAEINGNLKKAENFREKYKKAKEEFEKLYATEAKILSELERTTNDLGMLEFLSGTLSGSADTILGLFAKKIKATFARIDEFMFNFQHEAVSQFERFKKATKRSQDRPQDFNAGLYETVTVFSKSNGEWVAHDEVHFVQEIDTNRWNLALNKMFQQAAQIEDEDTRKEHIAQWFTDNTVPRSQEEIDKIREEKDLEMYHGYISKEEHAQWESKNMSTWNGSTVYMRDLAQPDITKYGNSKYQEIQRNPAMKEYYDYLINSYKEAQKKYPVSQRMGYRLPSIAKSNEDYLREKGGLKRIGQNFKDYILSTYQDSDRYKSGGIVPTYFTQFMPAEMVSLDLIASVTKFTQAAMTYEAIAGNADPKDGFIGLETEAKSLLSVVQEREIEKTDSKTKTVMKDAARKLGFTEAEVEKKGGLYAAFLKHFIDQNLYGVGEDKILLSVPEFSLFGKKLGGGQIDTAKATNTFISLASWPALGGPFTILKALANKLNAEANILVEAHANQYLTKKNLLAGKKRYDKWLVSSSAKDYASPVPTSIEGQLMEWFSPMQGEFRDKVGDDLSWSGFKRAFVPGSWFFLQKAGEHSSQMSMFFGMLESTKVKMGDIEIPLSQAYELDSHGKLKLKEGVEFSSEDKDALVNRIHAINKGLHGIYNKMDKSVAQKQAIGRLAFMYRKFLVPAVKRRWGSIKVDQELGDTVEGFHRTLINVAINDFKELIAGYRGKSTKLTPMEQANIRRSVSEIALVATLAIVIASLTNIRDKDPDLKKGKGFKGFLFNSALYEAMRLRSEFEFFLPVIGTGDQLRVFTSPSAANNTLQKLFNLGSQLFNPLETYEQSSEYHKKGDSKLAASVSSLLGLNGLDAKRAQEQFNKLY